MARDTERSSRRDPQPGSARSRARGKPVQVQAKTPWGFILGSAALGLALIAIVAYAVLNQGEGFEDPVERADKAVEGVTVSAEEQLTRGHVPGRVRYATLPPPGGDHNSVWQTCQVYGEQVPTESAVHSMEHGAVWITYRPELPVEQVEQLRSVAEGEPYVLMSPLPGQEQPVVATAWGRQLSVPLASDDRVEQFVDVYANGPQTPEKGATCGGGSTATGDVPPGGAAPAPAPQGSARVPTPSPSRG